MVGFRCHPNSHVVSLSFHLGLCSLLVLFTPVGEAASIWRAEKLKDFEWRIRCLGKATDPEFSALLLRLANETEEVEKLWQTQKEPSYQRRWWQDGEYDDERAEVANDEGVAAYATGKLSEAFDRFTEAIRLRPTCAVYHSNRSAVALKLGRPDIAVEDAENALERNCLDLKALLRAGRSHLEVGNPEQARERFSKALELNRDNKSAQKGLFKAKALEERLRKEEEEGQAYATAGRRKALSREECREEEAAMQLLGVEEMLTKNPKNEALKCAKVECLIYCSRYGDALCASENLLKGVEQAYLQAEALWRDGQIEAAIETLTDLQNKSNKSNNPVPDKIAELMVFLDEMNKNLTSAECALEDGTHQDVIEICDRILSNLNPDACKGFYCRVLRLQSNSFAMRGDFKAAKTQADRSLEVLPSNRDSLKIRADIHKRMGAYLDYFLDIQRLKIAAPGTAGLDDLLEDAARLCMQYGMDDPGSISSRMPGAGPSSAYDILGLPRTATVAEIRKAYLSSVGKVHPDKWVGASETERAEAEEKFKSLQAAYEALTLH